MNNLPRLNICMLLPLRYETGTRVVPQIGICSYLTNFGHRVTWIVSSEKIKSIQQVSRGDVNVHIIPQVQYLNFFPLIGGAISKFIYAVRRVRFILKISREAKYHIFFVRNEVLDGLLAVYLRNRHGIPLVFELSSPLEEGWETAKVEAKNPGIWPYFMDKFKALARIYIMKRADLVLPTTRWFEEDLAARGIPTSKLMPYPNGADIGALADRESRDMREKYHLGSSKVMIYLGVIGKSRKLEVLIKAFAKVKKEKKNVKLLMIGDGNGRKNLEKLTSELGLEEDVIFTGQVRQSEVPDFIAAADIGVSPVPPFSFYKVSSPIKMLEYMAMAKPVVVNEEIFDHKEVIEQSRGGILVPFQEEAFARAIIELLNDAEKATEMGRKGREWVVKNRSFEVLARRLEEKYFELLNKPGS